MKVLYIFISLISITLFGIPVSAQTAYEEKIEQELLTVTNLLAQEGFSPSHDYEIGSLLDGTNDYLTLFLRGNKKYAIIAICDEDCKDIDIKVFDDNNNLVAIDEKKDATPIVTISPRWSGKFTIKVSMYNCIENYCYYGLGIYKN